MAMSLSLWMRITFAINSSLSQSWSPISISFVKRWMRLWNGTGACLKRSAGTSENPGALWDVILNMNCEISLKVVTGSRIVSPLAMVRKSNIPALSRKILSLVRCRVLRKFVGSVLKLFKVYIEIFCYISSVFLPKSSNILPKHQKNCIHHL